MKCTQEKCPFKDIIKSADECKAISCSYRTEQGKLYTLYQDNKPVAYRYGESWRAMQLMNDGGYPTPEEAKAAWEREQEK